MSTASRDCGKTGGARARCLNAPSAPGASVGPRGHYDPRAFGQLGSLKKTVLKRPPEAEIAAPVVRAVTPVEYSGLRGARLRHSPPPIPAAPRPPPQNPPAMGGR